MKFSFLQSLNPCRDETNLSLLYIELSTTKVLRCRSWEQENDSITVMRELA